MPATPNQQSTLVATTADRSATRAALSADREEIRSAIAEWHCTATRANGIGCGRCLLRARPFKPHGLKAAPKSSFDRSIASYSGHIRAQHFIGASAVEVQGNHANRQHPDRDATLRPDRTGVGRCDLLWLLLRFLYSAPVGLAYSTAYPDLRQESRRPRRFSTPPVIDAAVLSTLQEGFRHIAYVQSLSGATVTRGLIVPRSDGERRLYEDRSRWMALESANQSQAPVR